MKLRKKLDDLDIEITVLQAQLDVENLEIKLQSARRENLIILHKTLSVQGYYKT